jgi:N-acetyl-anhydromuramyl-L-alanine amidase AmpD
MNIHSLTKFLSYRERDIEPELVVLHATMGGTARSSINHLRGVGLSYHYIISRDANDSSRHENIQDTAPIIYRCVPDNGHAFHVGSTIPAPGGRGINKSSIGISLANIQRKKNPEPYPLKQMEALQQLLKHLKENIRSLKYLTTHAVIQPWNRTDPLFIDGKEIALSHGFIWWQPNREVVEAHRP